MALNADGDILVADFGAIRKVSPTGQVSTFVGKLGEFGALDGTGAAARFGGVTAMVFDSRGNLYVTDGSNHAVRKITPQGDVSTIAGKLGVPGYVLGDSPGLIRNPGALAIDAADALYVVVPTSDNVDDPVAILKIE